MRVKRKLINFSLFLLAVYVFINYSVVKVSFRFNKEFGGLMKQFDAPIKGIRTIQTEHLPTPKYNLTIDRRGRLGNVMFEYASLLGIAKVNNMNVVFSTRWNNLNWLGQFFNITRRPFVDWRTMRTNYTKFNDGLPIAFNKRTQNLSESLHREGHVFLVGFYQSFKYFEPIADVIRQELTFTSAIQAKVRSFKEKLLSGGKGSSQDSGVLVGVHVRRGDALNPKVIKGGMYAAPKEYLTRAMQYMKKRFGKVTFIIASDDIKWVKQNFVSNSSRIVYSQGLTAAEDLALLSSCDHTIISTGTFGWWASWLGKGVTVYYAGWPPEKNITAAGYRRENFYPSDWIPIE